MNIEFHSTKLQKQCCSEKAMAAEWGVNMAKRLKRRLADLEAAGTLEDMRRLPGGCHPLKGNRAGQLAVHLVHPQRLVFRPDHDPPPLKPDGGLDWSGVTDILILGVVDYH